MNRFLVALIFLAGLSGCATVSSEKQRELDESFVLPKTNKLVILSCYWTQSSAFSSPIRVSEKEFPRKTITLSRDFNTLFIKHLSVAGYDLTIPTEEEKCEVIPKERVLRVYIMNKVVGVFDNFFVEIYINHGYEAFSAQFRQFVTGIGGDGVEKTAKDLSEGVIKRIKMSQKNQ